MQIKKVALEEVAEVCEEVSAEEAKEPVMTAESALTETELSKYLLWYLEQPIFRSFEKVF